MSPTLVALSPFGLRAEFPTGTRLTDVDFEELKKWVDVHRVVQLRGVLPVPLHELSRALAAPEAVLALPWQQGDFVIADNHALLHGRRAFVDKAPRHLHRVNVLDPDRRWWAGLRAAWRVRRPEFFRAELPILMIPAFLSAASLGALASWPFFEGVLLFFLLFNVGDMINCWFDRDVDLHRKTHLAEAIARVGRRSLAVQIAGSAILATGLAVHLAMTLDRPWLAPAGLLGAVFGAGYTAPPLRLKSRGLVQLAAYVGLLFVGPMLMVAGVFRETPGLDVVLTSLCFGAMQTGVLLVNTAEDLDEDEREGIRTVAVVLQARGSIVLARALVFGGGLLLAVGLGRAAGGAWSLASLPLLAVVAWNTRWLHSLASRLAPLDEAARREAIRAQGKHVPKRIETGAWVALIAAAAVFAARSS